MSNVNIRELRFYHDVTFKENQNKLSCDLRIVLAPFDGHDRSHDHTGVIDHDEISRIYILS